MREYDNIDYNYKSSDGENEKALDFVSSTLGFSPDRNTLDYELNFFSGGIGVDDKLAFSCSVPPEKLEGIINKLRLITPIHALQDTGWGEDFAWLVKHDGDASEINVSSSNFINKNRKPFQSHCTADQAIYFERESNVNTWTAVWISDEKFNYLYSDQG